MTEQARTLDQMCFVLSPIGREGTEVHSRFLEVLQYVIRPAVEEAGYGLKVIRADDIERAGSFIKDILEYIAGARVVIADLTTQNPNVFYELGVRHALSSRTIMIAQSIDEVPSDLREYRVIVYDTTARGAATFRSRLQKFLVDIDEEPQRADNPVIDRLGVVVQARVGELESEVARLKSELNSILRTGARPAAVTKAVGKGEPLYTRLARILKLMRADDKSIWGNSFTREENGEKVSYRLPGSQGDFDLHFISHGDTVDGFLYISDNGSAVLEPKLADIRVLMDGCSKGQNVQVTFVIATDRDLGDVRASAMTSFGEMKKFLPPKQRNLFALELWDEPVLLQKEYELGIKVPPKSGVSARQSSDH